MFVNNYNDALAFIHGRTKFKKIPTLDRMRDFMKRLGNPHENSVFERLNSRTRI